MWFSGKNAARMLVNSFVTTCSFCLWFQSAWRPTRSSCMCRRRSIHRDARPGRRLEKGPHSALANIPLAKQFLPVPHSALPGDCRRRHRTAGSGFIVAIAADVFGLCGRVDSILPGVGQPGRLPHYVSILFPLQLVLALLSTRWKWSYEPLLAFSIALLALCTVLFANAYQMT